MGEPILVARLLEAFILFVVVPAWLCAGLADWACHRAFRIEATSGTKESVMHALQLGEVGVPLLAALFLEINALVLSAMAGSLVLHQATAIWDVRWANTTRIVPPAEQHIHGVLEMAPIMAFAGFAILNVPEVTEMLRGGGSFIIMPRHEPLPMWYLTAVMVAAVLMGLVPYSEEFVRCLRYRNYSIGR